MGERGWYRGQLARPDFRGGFFVLERHAMTGKPAVRSAGFQPVPARAEFVAMEERILKWWDDQGIVKRYLARNESSAKKKSFIDGPITANNPMGVHHAWGRTYKDLFLRFFTMRWP